MWTLLVVLRLPTRDLPACVEQVGEPAHPQALLAQPPVEALDMRVLRRLARLDVAQFDLPLQRPGEEMTTRELGAVVAANRVWSPTPGDDLIQHPGHAPAGETVSTSSARHSRVKASTTLSTRMFLSAAITS